MTRSLNKMSLENKGHRAERLNSLIKRKASITHTHKATISVCVCYLMTVFDKDIAITAHYDDAKRGFWIFLLPRESFWL